ncbi:MAG: glycoside hydrolase family 95 protein [Bryobacterales bacterium]|nr:glycoside hydrolase family 95 protein [Bryobacterales bacterium]
MAVASLNAQPNRLWYRQAAAEWVEAMPVGNGRLGAMVFGGAVSERIQLNEDSVWSGEKRDRLNPEGLKHIAIIRRLLLEGKPREAEELAERTMIAIPKRLPPYQTLGDLQIEFAKVDGEPVDYQRSLDLETGLVNSRFTAGGVTHEREVFATAVHGVLMIRLTANRPGAIRFQATLTRPADATAATAGPHSILMLGEAIARDARHPDERRVGTGFAALLEARAEGGTVRSEAGRLHVEGADAVTLVLAASTRFRAEEPASTCRNMVRAVPADYASVRAAHRAEHEQLFRRVDLQLGSEDRSGIPTDERIRQFRAGQSDPQLAALYFQFGRYLLMASSRPGSLPANLQGIWNERLDPNWESKYTININTQMNYWAAEVANLPEMHLPLFDLVDRMRVTGRDTARRLYGTSGFVAHHNTNIWADTVPVDGAIWGTWMTGGAWLSLHFWDHYEFSGDRRFLEQRAYPVLKEASQFLLENLTDNGKGELLLGPSISPEVGYVMPDGTKGTMTMGATMDTEITRTLFGRVIEASQILGIDAGYREKLKAARSRLPAFRIGRRGQLQEWLEDYPEQEPAHRHVSHLFALFPGRAISPRHTPELAAAAARSLELRGDGNVGWSRAWMMSLYARLRDRGRAGAMLAALLREHTNPNLFDGCYAGRPLPFQIDANFGGTAGIAEMLLQSQEGEVEFLPAIPPDWKAGQFRGLRARGGLTVDASWTGGRLSQAVLTSSADGTQRVRVPDGLRVSAVRSRDQVVPGIDTAGRTLTLKMKRGERLELSFR